MALNKKEIISEIEKLNREILTENLNYNYYKGEKEKYEASMKESYDNVIARNKEITRLKELLENENYYKED